MLNLTEYKKRSTGLVDYLPWACLIAPGVILNKDGSYQRSFAYRGPDLDSSTEAELVTFTARFNTVLKRSNSGWAMFFEAQRIPAQGYPAGRFADSASWLVDEERRAQFDEQETHFESRHILTLVFLPPPEIADRTERIFFERSGPSVEPDHARAHLNAFITETDRTAELMAGFLPELVPLDDTQTLTYLHGTISTKQHVVCPPKVPTELDAFLCDTSLAGGVAPRLGDRNLRVLTVLGFPNTTTPGLLDELNDLGFSYRWMTRWIALDKISANKQLTKLRRQWFSKRKSVGAVLREVMFNREAALVDSDADNKAIDADAALQELGADDVAFGHITTSLVVTDTDEQAADEKLLALERILNGRGLTTIRETLNAVEAWLGSLPGNPYANVRQPIVHTLNLIHMMPASAVWAGPSHNAHLKAPPLMLTETNGTTPFRLDLHVGDVGHTLIVGPTGAGKSVLLAMLALQFRRFIGAQVIAFDKGRSLKVAILAMGGTSFDLGLDKGFAFQPLADVDTPAGAAFAQDWVLGLLANEGVTIKPETKDAVWTAIKSLASAPKSERTLTGLAVLIQSGELSQALTPYTLEGSYGRLLDAADDHMPLADVMHFEMDELMQTKSLVLPVLTYLFHRLEERFGIANDDGAGSRPTLLILDEAWAFLDDPLFAARIREWLKVLRKKNVAVVFATQSLADIERSTIAPSLLESCPTRIFLPNDRALEPQAASVYERFGLNERQISMLASATPKHDYYIQTARGNRLFSLGLGPVALAFAGTSSPEDQRLIDQVVKEQSDSGFAATFLRAKDLDWAADLIAPKTEQMPEPDGPPPLPIEPLPNTEAPVLCVRKLNDTLTGVLETTGSATALPANDASTSVATTKPRKSRRNRKNGDGT